MLETGKFNRYSGESATPCTDGATNDNRALARFLYDNFHRELTVFLRRGLNGNAALAEDMAQDAIMRIAASDRRYLPDRARGLLYTVARNLLVDYFRSERTRSAGLASLRIIEHDVDAANPLETLVWREDLARVRAAILDLPPKCRQVFVLSRFEDMTNAAIARHCGSSVSMVEKHLRKALRLLTMVLESNDHDEVESPCP